MTGPRTSHSQYGTRSELKSVLARFRNALIGVGLMSGMINVLYLTGSFFMLQIYDRVLPSRSIPTLVGLLVFALVLYVFLGILDVFRGRVLVRIGTALDEALTKRVFDLVIQTRNCNIVCGQQAYDQRSDNGQPAKHQPESRKA